MALSRARLKEVLTYEPESGIFIRNIDIKHFKAGTIAGTVNYGYINIGIDGKSYGAHRLAYLYMEGHMPEEVDHDNHIRNDNRWLNLNASSKGHNAKNHTKQSNNTSGVVGVSWSKKAKKWNARIGIGEGSRRCLGFFNSFSSAVDARKDAEVLYGYNKNHGGVS